jgi:hypothetical protein
LVFGNNIQKTKSQPKDRLALDLKYDEIDFALDCDRSYTHILMSSYAPMCFTDGWLEKCRWTGSRDALGV